MKRKFAPANDTLAVMALRPATEPVTKLAVTSDCVLLTLIVSIIAGILTPYRESHITLKAGQTVYFVASEREGYSYIVFLYADGSSLCSCKDGCQHKHCQHTDDAASYEARLEAATKANLIERKECANGTILYTFQSSRSDWKYLITTDHLGNPDMDTHNDCIGYRRHGHCKHMDTVLEYMPVYEPRTERDASLQAQWGSPVYDDAHYNARHALQERFANSRPHIKIECKEGLSA